MVRKTFLALSMALVCSLALAHHGWRWTENGQFELIGVIEEATLGAPHGTLVIDADGEKWTAVVGHPDRNKAAGLKPADFKVGAEITVLGRRATDPKSRRVKAIQVKLAGKTYDLYPSRSKSVTN